MDFQPQRLMLISRLARESEANLGAAEGAASGGGTAVSAQIAFEILRSIDLDRLGGMALGKLMLIKPFDDHMLE